MNTNPEMHPGKSADLTSPIVLNLFWLGFIIYIASFTISATNEVNYVVCNAIQVVGLGLFLPSTALLISFKFENNYLRIMLLIYFLWLMGVVARGITFDYESIKQMLFDPYLGLFPYLVPLVVMIPVSASFLKRLFLTIIVLSIIYVLYDSLFIRHLLFPRENIRSQAIFEYFTRHLSLPAGFTLLTYVYHKKKVNLFLLFILSVTFVLAVIRARRGLMFMSFSMLFFAYFIYQYANKTKVINIVISLFLVLIVTYAVVRVYSENRKDTFSLITERIGQQTRTEVVEYFYNDLKTRDWIIGKGINGKYFCPGVNEGEGRITIYRGVVETGFLQIILKSGIIGLALLTLIALPAVFMGIFRSRNILAKAAGIWVLLMFLFLYPGMPVIFSLNYLIIWISIRICYSSEIRNLSDQEVLRALAPLRKQA